MQINLYKYTYLFTMKAQPDDEHAEKNLKKNYKKRYDAKKVGCCN